MNNLTYEQVQEKINFVCEQIEAYFKTINTPENILIKKDKSWGQRIITIYMRLDEFSVEKLETFLPQLKELYTQYRQLREYEKTLNDQIDIEQQLQKDTINSIWDSK